MRFRAAHLLWALVLLGCLLRLTLRAEEQPGFVLADGPLSVISYGVGGDETYFVIGSLQLMAPPQSVAQMKLRTEAGSAKHYELVLRERTPRTLERLPR